MYLSKNALLVIASLASLIATVNSEYDENKSQTGVIYCEWGYCSLAEYCCGDNACCSDPKPTWILLCILLTALVVFSTCFGCFCWYMDVHQMRLPWLRTRRELLIPNEYA